LSNLSDITRRSIAALVAGVLTLALPAALAPSASAQQPAAQSGSAAAPRVPDRTLRPGDRGEDVKDLQRALRAAGITVTVDGEYGPGTKRAVQEFQATVGLDQSGTAGAETRRRLADAIRGSAAPRANSGGHSLRSPSSKRRLGDRVPVRRGMSGRDVRMLQDFLRRAGFRIKIDGEYGRGTVAVVKRFQKRQRRKATGFMNAGDIAALRGLIGADLISAPKASTPPPAPQLSPGERAQITPDGLATIPEAAPEPVKAIIMAANQIAKKPYIYGGGHRSDWKEDSGYDCSGSVSWALRGWPSLIKSPLPSYGFYNWGEAGPGKWVTIYTKDSHMYAVIAGLRFDTSGRSKAGTRWQADMRPTAGFKVRHPAGL
jgi:peptidoglycan hydrolase-like protein with peptidoglycan-binding domain